MKDYRDRKGLSQAELAQWVGVKTQTVARWEQGKRQVPSMLRRVLALIDENSRLQEAALVSRMEIAELRRDVTRLRRWKIRGRK